MDSSKNIVVEPELTPNDLAFERTILGENRTLMAWIRTSISLISFGFTIYKFFHETAKVAHPHKLFTARHVGMLMIGFGLLGLIWGMMDHIAMMKKLRKSYPPIERSRVSYLAILVLLFGVALFLGAFFRQ